MKARFLRAMFIGGLVVAMGSEAWAQNKETRTIDLNNLPPVASLPECGTNFGELLDPDTAPIMNSGDEASLEDIVGGLLNKALEAALGQGASIFLDAFLSDFFGSEQQLVLLSQESLDAIRDIVREEVDDAIERYAQGEARSLLASVQTLLDEYVFYVNAAGCGDRLLLNDINTLSQRLVDDEAFSSDVSNGYFFLIRVYATAASLRISVLLERSWLNGIDDRTFIRTRAEAMDDKLHELFNGVTNYVSQNVRLEIQNCPGIFCTYTVRDLLGQRTQVFRSGPPAEALYSAWRSEYIGRIAGPIVTETRDTLQAIADE